MMKYFSADHMIMFSKMDVVFAACPVDPWASQVISVGRVAACWSSD